MNLAQIAAIIALLLAFGVDQPTVTKVGYILRQTQATTTQQVQQVLLPATPQTDPLQAITAPMPGPQFVDTPKVDLVRTSDGKVIQPADIQAGMTITHNYTITWQTTAPVTATISLCEGSNCAVQALFDENTQFSYEMTRQKGGEFYQIDITADSMIVSYKAQLPQ